MGYQNQYVGWSQEAKLLQQITKQLDRLTKVISQLGISTTTTSTTTAHITTTSTTTHNTTTTTTSHS